MARKTTRTITEADLEAARNLKRIYNDLRQRTGKFATVTELAVEFGVSRSMISQYMNGHAAIGPVATLRFARLLRCAPSDIRSDFEFADLQNDLSPEAVDLALQWMSLPAPLQRDVAELVDTMSRNPAYGAFIALQDARERAKAPPAEA